jgi:photosystem II stability/assembly factor-like uncharacterized protein
MTRFGPLRAVLLFGVLATLAADSSHAQWIQTNGPRGGTVRSLLAVPNGAGGTRLYAGQLRLWRTDDRGASWSHLNNGLPDPNAFTLLAVPDGSGGNDILVGTNAGIFRSTDDGASWSAINNGITNLSIYALALGSNGSGGTNLYAGTYLGNAFRSTNNGASWTAIQSGLPTGYHVGALTTTPAGTVLAGTMNGIYRSTNFGATWTQVFNLYGFSFARNGSTLYVGTSNGVYRSTNDGATWTPINNGMGFAWISSVAAIPSGSGATLFAGAGRVLRSTDNGATWVVADNGMTSIGVYALATAPDGSGGTDLYAGTSEGVFRTSDNGDTWTNVSFIYSQVRGLEVTPSGAILAGTDADAFRSPDGGATWTDTNSQSVPYDFAVNLQGTSGVSLFAVDASTGIHKSTNDGVTWFDSNNGIDDIEVNSITVVPNGAGGSNVLAGVYAGIFLSTNDGGSWQSVNPNPMPMDWVVTPNGSGGQDVFGGGFGGVWRSTNYGVTWAPSGLGGEIVQAMATTTSGTLMFAGGDPFGVYRSTDHGLTWAPVNNGLTDPRIYALFSPDDIHLFAAGGGGVFLSDSAGESWSSVGTGLATGVYSLALSGDGSTLLAGTTGFGVWKRPLSEMIGTTGVDGGEAAPSNAIILGNNLPNPFRDGTTIQYALPRAMPARLVVYDVAGHAVRTLVNGPQQAGERRVTWDGKNEGGSQVSRGMYLYRLEAGGTTLTRKMILH